VEARHCPPREHGVVRDVFLVHIAVAREEECRGVHELTNREIVQLDPDDGRYPRALLSVDVDVREVRRIGELDEANVVVGDRLRLREPSILEQASVVLRRVDAASGGIRDDDFAVVEDPRIGGAHVRRGRAEIHPCATLCVLFCGREREVDDVETREEDRVDAALAREVPGNRGEPVDVLVPPSSRRMSQKILGVERAVRVADQVHGEAAVVSVGVLDELLRPLEEASHVRREARVVAGHADVDIAHVSRRL